MSNGYLNTRNVSIDYQPGGPGRGQRRILDVVSDLSYGMGEWTDSLGAITRDWYKDPLTHRMRPMPVRRGNPEAITFPLTCRMKALNILERFGPEDRLVVYKRYTGTLDPANLLNYRRIEVFLDCALVDRGHSAGATDGKDEEAWVDLTANVNAGAAAILLPVAGKSIPHGITAAADVNLLCGCIDPDGVIWLGTAAESGPAAPHILKGARDADGNFTWTSYDVTGQTADIVSLTAAGDALLFAIGTNLCRAEKSAPGTVTTTAFGAAVSRVLAIDAANLIAIGASGTVRRSEDGGLSWSAALTTGVTAALSSLAVRNYNDWWIGGATGTLLRCHKGTFTTLADPTSGATINAIALPDGREDEVYLGASSGAIWKTLDGGATWTQLRFPGDSAGSVDHLAFADWMGPVLYIVHSPVSGPARLLRDLAGGVGGNTNVEAVTIPANSGLNGLLVEGVNDVFLPGDVHSGANLIIKVEA